MPRIPSRAGMRSLEGAGDFGAAAEQGLAVGRLGYNVANKAAKIYGTYLEEAEDRKRAVLTELDRLSAQGEIDEIGRDQIVDSVARAALLGAAIYGLRQLQAG